MSEDSIKIQIELDDGSVKDGFLRIQKTAGDAAESSTHSFEGLTKELIKTEAVLELIKKSYEIIKDVVAESIETAIKAEDATNKFNQALGGIGKYSVEAASSFKSFAEETSKLVGISDILITQNASLLVSLGNLSGEGLERATKASIDLAAGLKIGLEEATRLVARATDENTNALRRHGLQIDQSIPKNQRFEATLKAIEGRFGGLAQSIASSTFQGGLDKVKVSFEDLLKTIGGAITESATLRATFDFISISLERLNTFIKSFSGTNIIDTIILKFAQFALFLVNNILPIVQFVVNSLVTGFYAVNAVITQTVSAFVGLGKLLVEAIIFPIRDLTIGVANIITLLNGDLGGKLKQSATDIAVGITEPFDNAFQATQQTAKEVWDDLNASFEGTIGDKLVGNIQGFVKEYSNAVNQVAGQSHKMAAVINSDGIRISQDLQKLQQAVQQTVGSAIVKIFSSSLQSIGASLVKGASAFSGFQTLILGILGDLAIHAGELFLAFGVGLQNLQIALTPPFNPGLAIAAGVALIALGGALKALSQGETDSGAASLPGATAGGGIASTPGGTGDISTAPAKPATNIQVTVNGGVFDTSETGLRLVQILNDSFDKQGVVVTGGV